MKIIIGMYASKRDARNSLAAISSITRAVACRDDAWNDRVELLAVLDSGAVIVQVGDRLCVKYVPAGARDEIDDEADIQFEWAAVEDRNKGFLADPGEAAALPDGGSITAMPLITWAEEDERFRAHADAFIAAA